MKIHRPDAKTLVIEEIDSLLGELLRQIPASADPSGSEAATARLFPTPTGGREPKEDAEWRELVEPELRELFLDAVGVVQEDLKKFVAAPESRTLRLPMKHLEAWIHALNQARLALTARHGFTDRELEREVPMEEGERALVLFQVHFYGLLEEFFLRQLEE
ncbi:MAG TPA: DUF2017 family protein [Chthoniobacteraceae bacterium]|nr:DUF2017 family protein [Chthoniobacteraceae bacterium]